MVAFEGEMGAGKTTFIAELCRQLQVSSAVSSPTFSIINEYLSPNGSVYHLDLYRIKDEEEAIQAGVEELLHSGSTCFVEWPSRAPGLFPDDTVWVSFTISGADTRKLSINPDASAHSL